MHGISSCKYQIPNLEWALALSHLNQNSRPTSGASISLPKKLKLEYTIKFGAEIELKIEGKLILRENSVNMYC